MKAALQGKVLRGRVDFAAATEVAQVLNGGGEWRPDEYSVKAEPLCRQLDSIAIAIADGTFTVTIDGQPFSFLRAAGETAAQVRDALLALIATATTAGLGMVGAVVDGTTFSLTGTVGGERHVVTVSSNMTLTPGISTPPSFTVFKGTGRVHIRTAAAFTGAFDLVVQG